MQNVSAPKKLIRRLFQVIQEVRFVANHIYLIGQMMQPPEEELLMECHCNQPGEATHEFGDQRFCWASGAIPIPYWVEVFCKDGQPVLENHVGGKQIRTSTDQAIQTVDYVDEPPKR